MDNELGDLTKKIRLWGRRKRRAIKLAIDGTEPLRRMKNGFPDIGEAFARAFYELNLSEDKRANDNGDYSASLLSFEWCIEHYAGLKLWQWLPVLENVHQSLINRRVVKTRPRIYNDEDNTTYFIPHKEKRVMVWGSQCGEKLVVLQPSFMNGLCVHVRKVWPRRSMKYGFDNLWSMRSYAKNDYSGKYGDCRDKGYILSYEGGQIPVISSLLNKSRTKNPGKIDRAYDYWSEFASFMRYLRFVARDLDLDVNKLVRKGVV